MQSDELVAFDSRSIDLNASALCAWRRWWPRAFRAHLVRMAILSGSLLAACHAPSRVEVAPESAIAEVAELPAAIEFRHVGADGGGLDEPDVAQVHLSLGDAIRRAVTTDPSLQASLARVRMAIAEADQSRLWPNPILGVVLRTGEGRPQIEASFVADFIRVLQQPHRVSAADDRLRAAAADAVEVALDVISEVQERYLDAQAAAALLPVLDERRELIDRLVSVARARLDAGEGTRADVVILDAQRVELDVAIDRVKVDERTSRLRLARLIGAPSAPASWTLDGWSPPDLELGTEQEWIDTALLRRPEIQASVWRIRALGDEAGLAQLAPWEGASAGVAAERSDGWQFGPVVETPLPLFDDGSARRARNVAEQLEARHELTSLKRRIVEEVRTAHAALAASTTNLARIERELIPIQQQRRVLAEDAYRAGQTDVTPLFLAEQDLRVARTQAIEVEKQGARAFVQLQRAVGGPGIARRVTTDAGARVAPAAEPTAQVLPPSPVR